MFATSARVAIMLSSIVLKIKILLKSYWESINFFSCLISIDTISYDMKYEIRIENWQMILKIDIIQLYYNQILVGVIWWLLLNSVINHIYRFLPYILGTKAIICHIITFCKLSTILMRKFKPYSLVNRIMKMKQLSDFLRW